MTCQKYLTTTISTKMISNSCTEEQVTPPRTTESEHLGNAESQQEHKKWTLSQQTKNHERTRFKKKADDLISIKTI